MNDNIARIVKRSGLSKREAGLVESTLKEWNDKNIGFWPRNDSNRKDWSRLALILGCACESKEPVRFFAPVCPDYPTSITGELGTGILEANIPLIDISHIIAGSLSREGIAYEMNFILADTETDIEEIVQRLAGSEDDFLARCQLSVKFLEEKVPAGARVSTFSEFFEGRWHEMQYYWEERIKKETAQQENLGYYLKDLASRRTEKFKNQFGRTLSFYECLQTAIRHYAQYMTLGYWMRQYPGSVLINTDSPNLRAVRKSLAPLGDAGFLPKVMDFQQRIPIIVPPPP